VTSHFFRAGASVKRHILLLGITLLLSGSFVGAQRQLAANWRAVAVAGCSFVSNRRAVGPVVAFPGAEGFGRLATGGRGGKVIEVTNLNDSGTGSLRACIMASGPRTCVFRVGGTINLQSDIIGDSIEPSLTIAGQTAPGGGIAIKGGGLFLSSNTIVRYLRIRPGYQNRQTNGLSVGAKSIVDHCSISWSSDDLVYAWGSGATDITYQWNIISEGLNCNNQVEGCGSRGFLIGLGSTRISVHHNLFAHNAQRFPSIASGDADVVNNVMYNYWANPSNVAPDQGSVRANFVGNYYKEGQDTDYKAGGDRQIRLIADRAYSSSSSAYVNDNKIETRSRNIKDVTKDRSESVRGITLWQDNGNLPLVSRHSFPLVTITDALTAKTQVLNGAGAILPSRDSVDRRIVNEVINGTGRIIGYPSDVGGWPAIASGTPPADTDHDGMPDEWEIRYGFNPNNPSDGPQDADGDGYTNLEEYLNGTSPAVPVKPPRPSSSSEK
jgi:pectate lyase